MTELMKIDRDGLPPALANMTDDALRAIIDNAGKGIDDVEAECIAVPLIKLLQKSTPAADPDDPAYLEGAEPGMWLNAMSSLLLTSEIRVIPCAFQWLFQEWAPGEAGNGTFIQNHTAFDGRKLMKTTTPDDKNNNILSNGNMLVDTRVHYVLYKDPNTDMWSRAVLSFKRTGIKRSKAWMGQLENIKIPLNGSYITPPTFCQEFILASCTETSPKNGKTYKNFNAGFQRILDDPGLIAMGAAYEKLVKSGGVVFDEESAPKQEPTQNTESEVEIF